MDNGEEWRTRCVANCPNPISGEPCHFEFLTKRQAEHSLLHKCASRMGGKAVVEHWDGAKWVPVEEGESNA